MEKRFIGPVILSLLIIVYGFAFLLLIPFEGDLIPLYPGGAISDYILVMVIPIVIMILMYFIGHLIAKAFISIHKLMKLNRYEYFLIDPEKKITGSRIIIRSVYPGLLAINIAIYIALLGEFNHLFAVRSDETSLPAMIEWIAIIVGAPIAILIITPIWILDSAGLMCSLNLNKYKTRVTPDIESVGRFYSTVFKGYVGISTIITYILIIYTFAQQGVTIQNYFIIFIDPLVLILFFVFLSLILEAGMDNVNKRLIKGFEKMGINITPQEIKIVPKE
ncbi:MAG: hypothetical protein ACFFDK_13365 [Promethearchaeota archaeon]